MFKRIKQFITENAARLSSQLSDLESNVDAETRDIRATFFGLPLPLALSSVGTTGRIVTLGTVPVCDTSGGSFAINLMKPAAADSAVGYFSVVKTSAANTLTIVGFGCLINGAASKAFAAAGHYIGYYDGTGFWF